MNSNPAVPKIPHTFFKWYCQPERYEELHGDLEEMFYNRAEKSGLFSARLYYWFNVIRCCQPYAWKKNRGYTSNAMMLNNYFKVSVRGLLKNPSNSFINIFGLAVAIGVCVFAYGFTRWTYATDQFHEHKNEVFLVTFFANRDGESKEFGLSPGPLGEMMREDFAQIKKMSRVIDKSVVVRYEENVFHERVRMVDSQFLDMLTFPLKAGEARSLNDVSSVILSEETATKYFGDDNPLGKTMVVNFEKERSKAFVVTGVADKFPAAHTIDFDFLINAENVKLADARYDAHDWSLPVNATIIQVSSANDIRFIAGRMDKYRLMQNEAVSKDWAITSFGFEPLATLHERSADIKEDISQSSGSNYQTIFFLVLICAFIMAIACFNYINIAIVSAAKRLKEIGVRKSIGATRGLVMFQFLSENVVVTFFALVLGVAIGSMIFIPAFEQAWGFDMDFKFNDARLWIYLPVILFATALISGIYPSFYISRFQATEILKGTVRFGTKNGLTKGLLGIQLVLACILLTIAIMFAQNNSYLSDRSWGYDPHDIVYTEVDSQPEYEKLAAVMAQNPDVISISGSEHHIGRHHATAVIRDGLRDYEVDQLSVDATYFETIGLTLESGRTFNDHEGSDRQGVIVNQLLVRNLGWQFGVGRQFQIDSVSYEVIGVVNEFHNYSFSKPVRPTMFLAANKADVRYLSMRTRSGKDIDVLKSSQAQWAKLFPETPFQGGLQEDVWGNYFEAQDIYAGVTKSVASIALILTVLGLYGLITLNVAGRVREFSIRKVLGAGVKNITSSITRQYFVLFAIALSIGAPISYSLGKMLFETSFVYHMPIDFSGAMLTILILTLMLFLTAATQVRKVLRSNPVNGLKVE